MAATQNPILVEANGGRKTRKKDQIDVKGLCIYNKSIQCKETKEWQPYEKTPCSICELGETVEAKKVVREGERERGYLGDREDEGAEGEEVEEKHIDVNGDDSDGVTRQERTEV